MKISNLNSTDINGHTKLSVTVESEQLGRQELWFSTPNQYSDALCKTRLDGFLVGLLYPAMQYGENIHLDGCVSSRLLFNVNNYVVPLLESYSPSNKPIKVTANQTSCEQFDCCGVGTGFSAGVDSFCTVYDRYELESDPDFKINAMVFLNVGSHGPGMTESEREFAEKKFETRYHYLKAFPDELGLDFIPLNSNLHAFHPWGHLKTDVLTAVSGTLILQKRFRRHYYSSSGYSYEQQFDLASFDKDCSLSGYSDPVILPLLSTESIDILLDGMQYTRVEKTARFANYEPARKYLNVCISPSTTWQNCSVCKKCCRTLMTLETLGKLDEFSSLFDIEKYKKEARFDYMYQQIRIMKTNAYASGNVKLARQRGVKLPGPLACFIYGLRKGIPRRLRRLFQS